MYSEKLYALAFAFRKTKLWKSLYDSELFAVTLPDGEIGYCSVMGYLGEHLALALYTGNRGLDSYRRMQELNGIPLNELKTREALLCQDCIQCSFENKDQLEPETLNAVRAYAAAHGITLRGANAFPMFTSYRPARYPWEISDETEEQRLCAALEGALEVAGQLKSRRKSALGLREGPDRSVPLLTKTDEGFTWTVHPLPPKQPPEYPRPEKDELLLMRLKKAKRRHTTWACDVVMMPQPIAEEEMERPAFPFGLVAVVHETQFVLHTEIVFDLEKEAQTILRSLGDQMVEHGVPAEIVVVDERTYALLEGLTSALKIKLTMQEEDELLDEMEDSFVEYLDTRPFDGDDVTYFVKLLMELDDEILLTMPEELWENLCSMDRSGLLPGDITARLRDLAKRRK